MMNNIDREFQKRIQETFRLEAEEHLKTLSSGLILLERNMNKENNSELIESLFREVHSLKGAARSIGQRDIESVCQPFENVFSALKNNELIINTEILNLFFETTEYLTKYVSEIEKGQTVEAKNASKELINELKQISSNPTEIPISKPDDQTKKDVQSKTDISGQSGPSGINVTSPQNQSLGNTVRIPISKLDPLLLHAEEFLQTKISFSQQRSDINSILEDIINCKNEIKRWQGKKEFPETDRWDEWCETSEMKLSMIENKIVNIIRKAERDRHNFDRIVTEHIEMVKQMVMLPVSTLIETFPAMVREIARNQHKEINLIIKGAELEIDKRILEELKDPLLHILRNSIDHGIETPEIRIEKNKPTKGTINISFFARENGLAEVVISDDGQGVDTKKVLESAIKTNAIPSMLAETMRQEEILPLIFKSGISTNTFITDLSGRGIGLSIVKEKVEKLNGKVLLKSSPQNGTVFHIHIPMTMATFHGTIVQADEQLFVIPTMNVDHILRLYPDGKNTVESQETITINDLIIPVIDLNKALGIITNRKKYSNKDEFPDQQPDYSTVVVLSSSGNKIAFKVDKVIDEQQVLVKSLGKLLKRVRNISGATILGSGKVVPVLHIPDLMKSAGIAIEKSEPQKQTEEQIQEQGSKILVVEDSITSRTLLKNILETSGYEVSTAVDGADAFMKVKSEIFDLIVSDVDMPRMNGFELTAKVKNEKSLSKIPVILVTSLESREDKERGIDVGANAYIVKSRFDQGNLLDTIKKLI